MPSGARAAPSAVRGTRPRIDVLIPAHDEERVLAATLRSVQAQLRSGDRILVVADNCTDGTAGVARTCGADVVERQHASDRGKGFALDFGVRQLNAQKGDVVVIVDADCTLGPGTLDALASDCGAMGRPTQASYVMDCPPNPSPRDLVSRVAVTVKNIVRQRGATTLGGPAILTGSGMAFPWETLSRARLASGNIVEDMQLSFDLLVADHAPRYCAEAMVTASLPPQGKASVAQRTRWEHGHLQTLLHRVPRLAWLGLRQCAAAMVVRRRRSSGTAALAPGGDVVRRLHGDCHRGDMRLRPRAVLRRLWKRCGVADCDGHRLRRVRTRSFAAPTTHGRAALRRRETADLSFVPLPPSDRLGSHRSRSRRT